MKKNTSPSERAAECIAAWHDIGVNTDVEGSYTGTYKVPENEKIPVSRPYIYMTAQMADNLRPIQDADDL